jgi:hypothetical protein
MSVKHSCAKDRDLLATELDVTNGEVLEWEVTFLGAKPTFAVVDQHGTVVLSPKDKPAGPGRYLKRWPSKKVRVPDDLNFTLGMHFIAATRYAYRVTRRTAGGHVIETCKDCTYASTTATDSFFDPLRVFTF